MRKTNLKFDIQQQQEAEQIASNRDGVVFLTINGVTAYTNGFLTRIMLKEMRSKKEGPAYLRRGNSVYYLKTEIDKYLESLKVVPDNKDILAVLGEFTLEERVVQLENKIDYLIEKLTRHEMLRGLFAGQLGNDADNPSAQADNQSDVQKESSGQ
jgi:hypothetical protein